MGVRRSRQRVWFERWIKEGYSVRQLATQSGYSAATLRRLLGYWLARPPQAEIDLSGYRYLLMDGTYLAGRQATVVAIADPSRSRIVTGWYGVKEGSTQMRHLCWNLAEQGLQPLSVTIDGLPQMHTLVATIWPQAMVQRCLVHVQRQGLAWCRHHPRRTDARHLRALFLAVNSIGTQREREAFITSWRAWESRFGQQIATQRESGRIFSDVKRARSMLSNALPYMFAYLNDPQVPKSTNWLEGYFSRLKARYRQHRGLSPMQRKNYFAWYFYLCHT